MPRGAALLAEMNETHTNTPTLWWLGHSGFAIRFASITFYIDPRLSAADSPLAPEEVTNADMILCTHEHPGHMDPVTLAPMLAASPNAKVVLPKSSADFAHTAAGIPYNRMSTTDNGLRIEYFKDSLYGRVYAVPSAHPELNWHPIGGYPRLGYLIRFERITIYHAGDTLLYPDLAARLRPYNPTVAILPIAGDGNLSIQEGAQLAQEIGAQWLIPMHYHAGDEAVERFVEHLLGHRPSQKFKVFAEPGDRWTVPQIENT
jgi:L-ascorbate metabolism protein UlaG (beta-lactamase superfamily)